MPDAAYTGLAQWYDRLMRDVPYDDWIDWTEQMWINHWGRMPERAVELGCGTGNIAIPLAQKGMSIIGIDLSEEMLACAEAKWQNMKQRGSIAWLHQDMSDWTLSQPADSVIAYCDALNYVTDPQTLVQVFHCAYAGLNPGGLLLFDMLPEERFMQYAEQQPFVIDEGDLAYYWFCEYDEETGIIEHDLTFYIQEKEGSLYRKQREIHNQRAYDPEWVLQVLKEIGFDDPQHFTGLYPHSPGMEDRLFFQAVKKS